MKAFKNLKLRGKMLLFILSTSFLIIAAVVGFLAVRTHRAAIVSAEEFIQAKTKENAIKAQILLEEALNATRTLAYSFEGIRNSGDVKRETSIQLMRQILESYPQFLGVWTVWEPNAFDAQDSKYVSSPGHDQTGRFIPYWNRVGGSIALEFCTDYESRDAAGDYYNIPLRSGKEYLGEPYAYVLQGKEILMTSIAVPIRFQNRVVGVAGVDISVETIQQLQKNAGLHQSAIATIISNKGMVIANNNKDLVGKTSREFTDQNLSAIRNDVAAGKEVKSEMYIDQLNAQALCYYAPIIVGNTGTPWSFVSMVPVKEATAGARRTLLESLIVGLAGLVVLTFLIRFMAHNLTSHIFKGIDFAKRIANGDLTTRINFEMNDEIGELVDSLNTMSEKLREIVTNIHQNANYISEISSSLNSNSQELAEGSSEQASAAEEVSSSMEEMASNIQQNAENAKQTAVITMKAYDGIKESSNAGESSVQSMNEIAGKISIIGDIAFQTNILALNAAVESARAGEHGRGFAVVASEVRKLAERSKVAADAINNLSKTGVNVSREAGERLRELIPEIEKTTRLIQEISSASMEQSAGAEQINNALQQLNVIVQKNALTSQEMAKSSEQLHEMSEELKNNIAFFRL